MKADLYDTFPIGDQWVYEIKFDGIRAIAVKNGRRVQLFSRRGREITADFPSIARAVASLKPAKLVLDGEIVALTGAGHSSFQLLQNRAGGGGAPIVYYSFDLLHANGESLLNRPLDERKEQLGNILAKAPDPLRFSSTLIGDPKKLWKEMAKLGLEGMIAKDRSAPYEPNRRSSAWRKIKLVNEQEFVIGGYTAPGGSRKFFGALLLGYHDKDKLHFAAKVGTGFNTERLAELYELFQRYKTLDCPFVDLPSRAGEGSVTRGEMRFCTWLRPELVAQIKFAEWTGGGHLRQPVFLGLREDKSAREVVREKPKHLSRS